MRRELLGGIFFLLSGSFMQAQDTAIYLDETKPIEERVEDALKRMTVEEKIAMIHAQRNLNFLHRE